MSRTVHPWLALGVLLAGSAVRADGPAASDPPAPPPRPATRADLDHREAERLYARALLEERDSRLIDAIETLEKAVRLDPESAHLRRALVPLYLAVDRADDALQTCRKALDLEPGDYETWYVYARQLKVLNRTQDAIAALDRAAACPGLKDRPDLRLQVHFDLGVLHENAQEFGKAATAFKEVVGLLEKGEVPAPEQGGAPEDLTTQTAETYERLGRVCVRAKRFDEAIAAYRRAQEKDPQRRPRLSYNLADVYVGQGKLAEALTCLDEYLRTQPQGTEAYELKIDLLHRLGRGNEVVPALEAYARADDQNEALKILLAREYGAAGRADQARQLYRRLLHGSASPDVYRGLFALDRRQGRTGAADVLDLLNGAITEGSPSTKAPDGDKLQAARARAMLIVLRDDAVLVRAILPVARQRLQAHQVLHQETCRLLGLLADRAHALDDAELLFRQCLAAGMAGPRGNESGVYIGLLSVLWQEHKYEDVVAVCRQGLEHAEATNLLLFHRQMSQALLNLGKPEQALAEANRAVDIATEDENRVDARCLRARVLALVGRPTDAEADALALLKEFKTNALFVLRIRYTLSEIYSLARDYAHGEEQLQTILKEHPDEARAHNDLGYEWADQGKNLDEAERLIRRAIELDRQERKAEAHVQPDADQDNAAYLDSLGWVLFRRGKLAEARAEMEKACQLPEGADDPTVWDHAGDVYHKLGEAEKARAAWHKAVELYRGGRRQGEDRRKDIEHKLKLLEPAAPGR